MQYKQINKHKNKKNKMKPAINKSELFKRAWILYKTEGKDRFEYVGTRKLFFKGRTFANCLSQAWREAKQIKRAQENKTANETPHFGKQQLMSGMSVKWYRDYGYCGD